MAAAHGSRDDHVRHLDFIQLTITRMAANSFLLKGWAVTLVAALFALAAADSERRFVLVAYLPITVFWLLDGFYLSQERKYRGLYGLFPDEGVGRPGASVRR